MVVQLCSRGTMGLRRLVEPSPGAAKRCTHILPRGVGGAFSLFRPRRTASRREGEVDGTAIEGRAHDGAPARASRDGCAHVRVRVAGPAARAAGIRVWD